MHPKELKFYKTEEEGRSKMRYFDVYSFNVTYELKEGNTVYVLDKLTGSVENVASMRVVDLIRVLNEAEDKAVEDRYYFYKEVEERDNE